MKRLLGSFQLGLAFTLAGVAMLTACPATEEPSECEGDDCGAGGEEDGKGGKSGSKTSQNNGGKGGKAGGKTDNNGGKGGKAGSDTSKGGGGSKDTESKGGGGSKETGGKAGSTAGGTNTGGQAGAAGEADGGKKDEVTCSNTDKSIIPVDETGWVDKTCNTCGIQGAFYWYGDDNTKKTLKCGGAACADKTPPWNASSKGMCISGTATGSTDDWGAGIGLSLGDSGGENSVKSSFDATAAACGAITGFEVTIGGKTNDMPVRVGFSTSADGKTISPFVPVPDPNGSSQKLSVMIDKAAIPADWKSTDPSPPDPKAIFDLQFQVAADGAKAGEAFELCVTSVKAISSGGAGGGGGGGDCKKTNAGTVSGLDVKQLGSYAFQSNVNAAASGSQNVTGYTGSNCVALDVSTSGIKGRTEKRDGKDVVVAPASYPSIVQGWHWGKWYGSYSQSSAKAVSALSSVKSSMSFTSPKGNKWNVSYDMWVSSNKGLSGAPDGGSLEVMVWLDYSTQETTPPIGSQVGTLNLAGTSWEVWSGQNGGGWKTVSYRRTPSSAAVTDLDLAPFLKDAVKQAGVPESASLLSVQAGFELFDASGGGSINSYSVSIN